MYTKAFHKLSYFLRATIGIVYHLQMLDHKHLVMFVPYSNCRALSNEVKMLSIWFHWSVHCDQISHEGENHVLSMDKKFNNNHDPSSLYCPTWESHMTFLEKRSHHEATSHLHIPPLDMGNSLMFHMHKLNWISAHLVQFRFNLKKIDDPHRFLNLLRKWCLLTKTWWRM